MSNTFLILIISVLGMLYCRPTDVCHLFAFKFFLCVVEYNIQPLTNNAKKGIKAG